MRKFEIKGILFDSGRVLNEPSTGNWFISPRFFEYVDRKKYISILGVSKPNEKMYLKALEELKLLPEETIFIDDNIVNII